MTLKVVVAAPFGEVLLEKIRAVSPSLEVEQRRLADNRWPDDATTDAEVFYALSGVPAPAQAPNLRWLQGHWAGVDQLREHPIWRSDVIITSASGVHGPNIAQYILAQMLAFANRIPRWLAHQKQGQWPRKRWETFLPQELRGQTVAILGYGSVGRELARLCRALGMTVLVTKRDARSLEDHGYRIPGTGDPTGEMADRIYPPEATRSVVAQADFVAVTLPLTAETHHLVDEETLRAMKPTAYLINISRGGLVDEAALIKGLRRGWLAGAGLDVFEKEPLPESSPLWSMENVILTPHISGFTPHYDTRVTDLFAANLRRYLEGKPLLNVVNRAREY